MRSIRSLICLGISFCVGIVILSGCSTQNEKQPDFSGVKDIAQLATLECHYHNVARYHVEPTGAFFNLINIGEKNMWFEYDGTVKMGFNIEKVSVSSPDLNNVVTITIPEVEILGHPDINEDSMTSPIEANGWFTKLTSDDKKQALEEAQANLKDTADNDVRSKAQATERAKSLLEQYVKNTGEAIGKNYTVRWAQAEE